MTDLLCLHGALATGTQFDLLRPLLESRYTLHTPTFEGHGDRPFTDRPFRAESLAQDVVAYMEAHSLSGVALFGYSLGGYVACHVAGLSPERVTRLATLGTRYLWDAPTLERELAMADPAVMQAKVPGFVEMLSKEHHVSGWQTVVNRTRELLLANAETNGLTAPFLAEIQCPVRVIVGDRDSTAGVPESYAAFRAFPYGELEVLPGTPHPFNRVSLPALADSLNAFFG